MAVWNINVHEHQYNRYETRQSCLPKMDVIIQMTDIIPLGVGCNTQIMSVATSLCCNTFYIKLYFYKCYD